MNPKVAGRCPACGSETLVVEDGQLACDFEACTDPSAPAAVLTIDHRHILEVTGTGWGLEHPVVCRVGRSLLECVVHKAVEVRLPVMKPGRYYLTVNPDLGMWVVPVDNTEGDSGAERVQ